MKHFDVVFPLNFGLPAGLPANRLIAAAAIRRSREMAIPIFCAPAGIFDFGGHRHYLERDFPGYVSTVKQVAQLKAAAKQQGWRRVLLVAAPPHQWRALRDTRAVGFDVRLEDSLRDYPRSLWYAARSGHRQTRSWLRWWLTWELPARLVLTICRSCYEQRAQRD